jgi:DNA mismatch repair protein MutS2
VDSKSLATLELPKILDRLAGYAAFSASAALARSLGPTTDLEEACRRLVETTEARLLLSTRTDLTIGGAHDVRPEAEIAARGGVLDPAQLIDIKSTLISARILARIFEKLASQFPRLAGMASALEPCTGLIDAISRTLDERGEVLDSASNGLATIRRDLRLAHERLMTKMQRLLGDPKIVPWLQEALITQREGRFVVPLRAEFKGKLKAVIHDQSASGATLFVEPLTVVENNNQVRELELAERDEVRRILAALSGQIGEQSAAIARTVETIADIDLAFAKARYAEVLRASEPILLPFSGEAVLGPGSTVRLLAARHPLLDPATVVPIDLVMSPGVYALVITGPNTGGKTVTLKTAGLLALMAQCGLHIPATSGSELSVFDGVFADIGDEQSIEQSLSTFSSHITNTIRILVAAGPRSLVVLDELGAGTDPQEGSALARAILSAFLERPVTVLVATHYPELKTFAHATPGVENASVEFDLETLRPTYRLTVGLPGRSNALAIAERLGLGAPIIESARALVSPEDLRAESLLDEIHRQRDLARQAREEAEEAREEARALEAELGERLRAIEEERRQVLERARREAGEETEAVRQELTTLRRRLARAGQPLEALKAIEPDLEALEERVEEPVARLPGELEWSPATLRPGDKVRLPTLGMDGVISTISADQAEVQIGRLRVRARLEELAIPVAAESPTPKQRRRAAATAKQVSPAVIPPAAPVPLLELDLRGRLADEALDELERRLDAAYLAGMPWLRVIHGKGTGRLRQAIRQALKTNPYVASFEAGSEGEGGEGVTVVRLRQS